MPTFKTIKSLNARILRKLAEKGEMTRYELVEAIGEHQSNVYNAVNYMIIWEKLLKAKKDGRRKLISLTKRGQKMADIVKENHKGEENDIG